MGNMHTNIIEKIKDIVLVVLVFTTILLLYFLWGNESLETFMFNDEEKENAVGIESVLLPDQIVFGLGTEDYTVALQNKDFVWNDLILKTFVNFSKDANILAEEISEIQYKEVMSYPSVIAKFKYDIPFSGFCETYDIKKPQSYDSIGSLSEIGFSEGSPESAFIYDRNRDKYYRLVGNADLKMFSRIEEKLSDVEFTTYYTLKTFLGEESRNETLIPVELPGAISPISYEIDREEQGTPVISRLAETFFGENFDFVRKIEESNGTTIFMYGYGQKVLIINPNDGSLEYKQDVNLDSTESVTMTEALETALNFIGCHSGFRTLDGQETNLYLENVSYIGDKRSGYRFEFSIYADGNKIFYQENKAVIVEVMNGQVGYYRRELINFSDYDKSVPAVAEAPSAINMLAANYEYIKAALVEKGAIDKLQERELTFEELANEIEGLDIGYLKPAVQLSENGRAKNNSGQLIPVWAVEIKDFMFYFDLYTGEPQGVSGAY